MLEGVQHSARRQDVKRALYKEWAAEGHQHPPTVTASDHGE